MWGEIGILLHIVAVVAVSLRVLLRARMEPPVRLAWIMVVVVLPLVGVLGYLLFGEIRMTRQELQIRTHTREKLVGAWATRPQMAVTAPPLAAPVIAMNRAISGFDAVPGNDIHLLPEDDSALDSLIGAIDAATDHVHLLFYIWLPDHCGGAVAEAAARAARRGVAVRVLVDAVGSRQFVRSVHWALMEAAGVECHTAEPIHTPLIEVIFERVDLRNHRKIVVIDDAVGFTGSRNCSDQAFTIKARYAPWVDILVRIEGPVVRQMQAVFLQDWMSATHQDLSAMLAKEIAPAQSDALAQIVATGPDLSNGSLADSMVTMIHAARHSVTIATPYYVPEPSLDSAIRATARRGIPVTLIVPERNDSMLVRAASEGFFAGLTQAGVRLMLFKPGLLHAKIITVDKQMALIGSANMDRRSFELNDEMNLMIVDDVLTAELDARMASYIERSRPLTMQHIAKWSVTRRIRNNLLAIASPLL